MKTMMLAVILFVLLMLSDVQSLSLLNGNFSKVTSQDLPEESSAHVTNVLRELVNQESLLRFSMVQKIQELTLAVVEIKNDNEFLKKRIADLTADGTDLKKTNQALQARNENLLLKYEEIINEIEISHNSSRVRFQRVELELTSLRQSVNDIREVQTETEEDLKNISSSLSTVEKEIFQPVKTTTEMLPPLQSDTVAFYAYMSKKTGTIYGRRTLVFDVVKTNIGGGYLPSSGNFVVPMSGTYVFSWTFRVHSEAYHSTQLMVNEVEYGILHLNTNPGIDAQGTGVVVVSVAKGDIILVRTHGSWNKGLIISTTGGRTSFAGWKL